jgi:cytochrome c biogenesis protein CcmG, thiol:disulfide interchange protein DsbE
MVAIRTVVRGRLALLVLALFTVTGCAGAADPAASSSPSPVPLEACPTRTGTPIAGVPATTLPCLTGTGGAVHVSQVRRRPTVINLWASWCPPCRHELPLLQRAHAATGGRVQFLGVDVRDSRTTATEFLAAQGVSYAQVYDDQGVFPRALGFAGVPDTLVVDARGRVVLRRAGEVTAAQLSAALSSAGVPTNLSER